MPRAHQSRRRWMSSRFTDSVSKIRQKQNNRRTHLTLTSYLHTHTNFQFSVNIFILLEGKKKRRRRSSNHLNRRRRHRRDQGIRMRQLKHLRFKLGISYLHTFLEGCDECVTGGTKQGRGLIHVLKNKKNHTENLTHAQPHNQGQPENQLRKLIKAYHLDGIKTKPNQQLSTVLLQLAQRTQRERFFSILVSKLLSGCKDSLDCLKK